MLFLISIESLTRKILSSSKIQETSLGNFLLKVSHYADDLTLFISSPDFFTSIRKIIKEFSLFSGFKINQFKTSIIFNSPVLLSFFRSFFSPR